MWLMQDQHPPAAWGQEHLQPRGYWQQGRCCQDYEVIVMILITVPSSSNPLEILTREPTGPLPWSMLSPNWTMENTWHRQVDHIHPWYNIGPMWKLSRCPRAQGLQDQPHRDGWAQVCVRTWRHGQQASSALRLPRPEQHGETEVVIITNKEYCSLTDHPASESQPLGLWLMQK